MNKKVKILAGFIAFVLIGIILWCTNGLVGNPISKKIAQNKANDYISKKYSDMELNIEKPHYNFKDGNYYVRVNSSNSKDTYFDIDVSPLGKIVYDSYETRVLDKHNTFDRINDSYGKRVLELFDSERFPYKSEIAFGSIETIEENEMSEQLGYKPYGIDTKLLELDKEYDINDLSKKYGHIVFYAQDEDISIEKVSEIMLNLKNILDKNEIYFYAIDFVLEKPRNEDSTPTSDEDIRVEQFLYKDIYEKDLEKRVQKSYEKLKEYYKILDEEKKIEEEKYS